MLIFAYIDKGKVRTVYNKPLAQLKRMFPASVVARMVQCDETVQEGWVYDGAVFSAPPDPAAENIRTQRTQLLVATDWTQLADCPLNVAQKTAWAEYRQGLRDVPQQAGFPVAVEWPIPPE